MRRSGRLAEIISSIGALLLGGSTVLAGVNTWTTSGPPGGANAVAIDSGNTSIFYSVNYEEAWRSTDGGQSWQTAFLGSALNMALYTVAAGAPSYTVYVGTCCFQVNLLKSARAGLGWTQLASLGSLCSAVQILVDPISPTTIYAVVGPCGTGPNTPAITYLAKSVDGGYTFGPTTLPVSASTSLTAFAIDPTNHETLYAATGAGLFKSTDGGSTWSLQTTTEMFYLNGGYGISVLVVDPSNPMTLYASVRNLGVFKSTDGGQTFRPVNNGLPALLLTSGLVVDPKHPSRLYVAVGGIGPPPNATLDQKAGVFATENGGDSWRPMSQGLPDLVDPFSGGRLEKFQLAIDPNGNFLLAATPAGVFEYEFPPELTPVRIGQPRPQPREISSRPKH